MMTIDTEFNGGNLAADNQSPSKAALELLANASIEATPKQISALQASGYHAQPPDWLIRGSCVYVPFLPDAEFENAFDTCEQLLVWGMQPIPHFPARAIPSDAVLHQWLARLQEIGVTQLLLIAGDIKEPRGPYPDTLTLLASDHLLHYGFTGFGFAAHPEGHPLVSDEVMTRALEYKCAYAKRNMLASWVVTQFSFDHVALTRWLDEFHAMDTGAPVYLGLAGPTRMKNLLSYAAQCGVATSAKMLKKYSSVARLLRPWTPTEVFDALVIYQTTHLNSPLKGVHLFPFGGLKQSNEWVAAQKVLANAESR
ncbi:methylenetetrahydrofolate reductase [Enterovibrio calviensis]|uniref:methylenetetrahydrofolate reductase n=1 Tax=Enterovibrio calviensis TaxID=91359 RepID=UPI0004878F06|nr:methylenetetrahydrofolate reductase [Enterovibrio calviensis]